MKRLANWGLLALLLLTACPASQTESGTEGSEDAKVLRIGFIPSENAAEIQRNAQPLVDQLQKAIGREVQSVVASDYTGVVESFRNQRLDVAFLTPASYVMAHNEAGVSVILRAQRGKAPYYYSVIFTRKDSKVDSLKGLKGKTFAFGDNLSTAGYIYPLMLIKGAGLNPETDFEHVINSGSHDATVLAVFNGKATAGATYANDPTGKDAAWVHVLKPDEAKQIKVLAVSEPIPSDNICVSKNLDPALAKQVQDFFLKLGDTPEGSKLIQDLYRIDKFIPATDADYQGIRDAIIQAGIELKPAEPAGKAG
ncbi:MAG: phosphate/phosphite/phosphonate ABC transporter substrate-binding protein [Candidatus Sericytochromatia bacterium]